jgi:oligoribonuclease NrnB/cAMP/cGMP phosphodiesterase (DHH superfamily)
MKVIIYHDDNDGRCAAAITLKAIVEQGKAAGKVGEMFVFAGATYDKVQMLADGVGEGDDVYILDFSFPPELMSAIIGKSKRVTWIDHHKSAIKALNTAEFQRLDGTRDTHAAACLLTWNFWYPSEDIPTVVRLIADRDAWIWAYKEQTAEFHYGLSLHDTHPQAGIWKVLFEQPDVAAGKIKSDGRLVLQALGQRFKDIRDAVAFDTEIDGHSARAMNIAIAGSAAFGAEGWATGALPDDVEICCQYYHNGEVFTVSLYSKKGTVDVSELCKKRGGGGHANAAGFTSEELPDFLRKS